MAVLGAIVVFSALLFVARTVDRSRGVSVNGTRVENIAVTVGDVALGFGATPVTVNTPAGAIRATAAEFGMSVDKDATSRAVKDARDEGPFAWVRGLLERRSAPLIVRVDLDITRALLKARDPNERVDPIEPAVVGGDDGIGVKQGKPGRGLSTDEVADALRAGARHAKGAIEVDVEPIALRPRFSVADARALAARARRLTAKPLEVRAASAQGEVTAKTLRSWIRSTDDMKLTLDEDAVLDDLEDELPDANSPAVDATIRIEGGVPVVVPGVTGTKCCSDAAPERILAALQNRPAGPLTLPVGLRQPERTTEEAQSLRITEVVGKFTTNHPRGQPRVTNIHRIADIIDGAILEPGKRFSVNDFVGERTLEKGFVLGGTIIQGKFVDTVGGGVSQFATTLFNAAFFAGLDIPAYQSHSIYLTRYPYGREATLSWPKPDLVISNTTPYGVLIDTSHTSSSITVTLWSTRYATGEQTGQSEAPAGNCKRVKTDRTRTYPDGTTKVDSFFATYRPEEGVNC